VNSIIQEKLFDLPPYREKTSANECF